jgi:hypothetical protein
MPAAARYVLAVCALTLAGCASFEAERSSRFIDENGAVVGVEYARGEERTTEFTAPNGAKLPYKSKLKVRVTLPDGDRFTAYRHMSLAGVLYKTSDEDWEYFEEGTACAVARRAKDGKGYLLVFQGTMCMNTSEGVKKKPRITGSSTPQGFGRPSSGPRDSEGPRTVEQK